MRKPSGLFLGPLIADHFVSRTPRNHSRANHDLETQIWGTITPDPTIKAEFTKIQAASFIAFDDRFYDIIGPNPMIEKLFTLPQAMHEAANYLPKQNKVFVSACNETYDYLIDLCTEPPTIKQFTADPPLESVNGGILVGNQLLVGTDGFRNSSPPGIYTLDPDTLKSGVLLNNYRGLRFNTIDDLTVDHFGNIWFVDAPFAWFAEGLKPGLHKVFDNAPTLPSAIYVYNITSGTIVCVDQSIVWPNGIAFSPDGKTLFVSDTPFNLQTEFRGVFAFDVTYPYTLSNKRMVYLPDTNIVDGLKVSEEGNLFGAAGSTIDVFTPQGELLGKISAGGEEKNLYNLVFLPNGEIILSGMMGIWRVKITQQGLINYGQGAVPAEK
ncbi:calcium-dependent phosphotriesterase [Lophium mytilinum]|uniref:Calcium-dependent phosphotriesterase n=1 Tax=Lophium mytilinum TaxID=390894 RepID=A0A6A6Q8L1_9PEZI|nr:calcium-dependent phosphotriesterase [Lophium mytilinum]